MDPISWWLLAAFLLSSILATIFGLLFRKTDLKLKQLQIKFKENPSYETQLLMADILRGDALFHISRVAPESVFLRR